MLSKSILKRPASADDVVQTPKGSPVSSYMGCVRITNHDLSTGRKLLVVKDSYGNAMGPFLGASFDEVHVVDFRYFEGDLPTYCTETETKWPLWKA